MKEKLANLHATAKDGGLQVRIRNGNGVIDEYGSIRTESGTLVLKDWSGGPPVVEVNFENAEGTFPNGLPEFSQAVEMISRIVSGGEIE